INNESDDKGLVILTYDILRGPTDAESFLQDEIIPATVMVANSIVMMYFTFFIDYAIFNKR
ncbi:MAG TPA: hypothetical protein VIM07_13875, partial [Chitinophagaceae bacterium]